VYDPSLLFKIQSTEIKQQVEKKDILNIGIIQELLDMQRFGDAAVIIRDF
jgi:hypothetical protein